MYINLDQLQSLLKKFKFWIKKILPYILQYILEYRNISQYKIVLQYPALHPSTLLNFMQKQGINKTRWKKKRNLGRELRRALAKLPYRPTHNTNFGERSRLWSNMAHRLTCERHIDRNSEALGTIRSLYKYIFFLQ